MPYKVSSEQMNELPDMMLLFEVLKIFALVSVKLYNWLICSYWFLFLEIKGVFIFCFRVEP